MYSQLPRITTADACRIAGLSQALQLKWHHNGVLAAPGGPGGCSELATVEMAIAVLLKHHLKGVPELRSALELLRPEIAAAPDEGPWDLVWDPRFQMAELITSDEALLSRVRVGGAVVVIPAGDLVRRVRAAFQAASQARPTRATLKVL